MALKSATKKLVKKGKSLISSGALKTRVRARPRRRRSRGMYLRRGRLFMGFSQKEVKSAMQRRYGGRRKRG